MTSPYRQMQLPATLAVELNADVPTHAFDDSVTVHGCHEVVYVVRGRYTGFLGDGAIPGSPGRVFCYPRGTPHRGAFDLGVPTACYVLQWDAPADDWPHDPAQVDDHDGRLLGLIRWMHDLTPPRTSSDGSQRDALLAAFLLGFRALLAGPRLPRSPLEAVRDKILAGYRNPEVTLEHCAAVAGMAPSRLCHLFSQAYGMPPMRYLAHLRVQEAARLLRETDRTLAGISAELGYCGPPHLCRAVRAAFGCTPGDLRAAAHVRLLSD